MLTKLTKIIAILTLAGTLASSAVAAPRQQSLLQAVNEVRAAHHLSPLRVNPTLARFAQRHSITMARTHVFAHALPLRFPIASRVIGEDLAWIPGDRPAAVVAAWMASPPHRANLLSPQFRRIGIGDVNGLVTADFAA